jgi:hypothetical protein
MNTLPWSRLVAAQFILILENRRWMELFAGAVALLAMALLVATFTQRGVAGWGDPSAAQQTTLYVWNFGLIMLAVVWPTFLWRDEAPSQRRYHWSLPAARGANDLARVAAGAIWLLVLAAVVVTAAVLWLPLAFPHHPDSKVVQWAGEFTVVLLAAYGLSSIAALATERPTTWILGVLGFCAAMAVVVIVAEILPYDAGIRRIPFELVFGKGGLLTLFFHFADRHIVAGPVWLTVAVVGLAIVTMRRTGGANLQRAEPRGSTQRTRSNTRR